MPASLLQKISHFDSSHRLYTALSVAGVVMVALRSAPGPFWTSMHGIIIWVSFALTVLLLAWITIFLAHPRDLPRFSRLEDSSRTLMLVFVLAAAVASLFAVIDVLGSIKKDDTNHALYVLLPILAVASSWSLVHTVFTLRYAHLYYGNDARQTKPPGGLDFPHETEPDYLDFAYFSFVIGMTSQVSDVAIGSKAMRRVALAHGVLSFVFNAIIIALTISGLSGLI